MLREVILPREIHVAVGVVVNSTGHILIAKRPATSHQGGLWEFPGGKVEPGESVIAALTRELQEELAIDVVETEPLIKIHHNYGDKTVFLDVHKVTAFSGQPNGNEGQPVEWVSSSELKQYEFPAANQSIISAIILPRKLLITGEFTERTAFFSHIENALMRGIRLVQLRLSDSRVMLVNVGSVNELCLRYSAQLMVNTGADVFQKIEHLSSSLGLHLNSKNLLTCDSRPLGLSKLLSASCHNATEIAHAQKIGVDFICLSPVLTTNSHPGQPGMGWKQFEMQADKANVPVYALGGMNDDHLSQALNCGAQGIAGISAWWG